ncbi:MAG: metalloregulator ArsR/SmtB family transcription factor [Bacillota bacterium]|nr:metalloregulator ArsR/SmtB family transcription factor [Bacillota bacterium]
MEKLIDFFKILSDETRLRILALLSVEELCVCEICGALELTQPKVSKHLSKMRDKGFVITEKKEQFVFYKLNLKDETIINILKDINKDIDNFNILKKDREKLQQKEKYLNECNLNLINDLK